jgi:hypothetical protein
MSEAVFNPAENQEELGENQNGGGEKADYEPQYTVKSQIDFTAQTSPTQHAAFQHNTSLPRDSAASGYIPSQILVYEKLIVSRATAGRFICSVRRTWKQELQSPCKCYHHKDAEKRPSRDLPQYRGYI